MDDALRELLQPPADMDTWLKTQSVENLQHLQWGSFEEQLRHWWSNECPCFVVEELCQSQLTCVPRDGVMLSFDGTLRVGFSLHRIQDDSMDEEAAPRVARYRDFCRPLFGNRGLRVHWLGGYWKLPVDDSSSMNLRARVMSAAKQGTAPIEHCELHDVYSSIGDLVRSLFEDCDLSPRGLQLRYASFPEFSAFVASRLATSLKAAAGVDRISRLNSARALAEDANSVPCSYVSSYVERMRGVMEAMQGNWRAALLFFQKSLKAMPTNATTLHLLGMYHREMREDGLAAKMMEHALLLDPDFKAPYANLGAAYLRMGDHERAASISEGGLARHPGTPQLQYNLAMATLGRARRAERDLGPWHLASELRSRALDLLLAARKGCSVGHRWTKQDEGAVAALQVADQRLDQARYAQVMDGWHFVGWRP